MCTYTFAVFGRDRVTLWFRGDLCGDGTCLCGCGCMQLVAVCGLPWLSLRTVVRKNTCHCGCGRRQVAAVCGLPWLSLRTEPIRIHTSHCGCGRKLAPAVCGLQGSVCGLCDGMQHLPLWLRPQKGACSFIVCGFWRLPVLSYMNTYIHTCMHACMHACIHTCIHTYI